MKFMIYYLVGKAHFVMRKSSLDWLFLVAFVGRDYPLPEETFRRFFNG